MTNYLVVIIGVTIFDIYRVIKERKTKGITVIVVISLLAIGCCYIYVNNPFDASFAELLLKFVESDYVKGR